MISHAVQFCLEYKVIVCEINYADSSKDSTEYEDSVHEAMAQLDEDLESVTLAVPSGGGRNPCKENPCGSGICTLDYANRYNLSPTAPRAKLSEQRF